MIKFQKKRPNKRFEQLLGNRVAGFLADSSELKDKQEQYQAILEVPRPQLAAAGLRNQIKEGEALAANY